MGGEAVWPPISDALVRGAHHELNNRLASLAAVEQVISSGGEATPPLREALVTELKRMRGAIDLLGRLPSSAPVPVAPVRPCDLLSAARELIRLHHEMSEIGIEIGCDEELRPVRVDPEAVERALLVMMWAASRSLADLGGKPLRFDCRSDDASVTITASPLELTEAEMAAVATWLRPSDAYVARAGPRACSLSLPALPGRG